MAVINQGRKRRWSSCPHSYTIGSRIPEFAKVEKEVGILLMVILSTHFFLRGRGNLIYLLLV